MIQKFDIKLIPGRDGQSALRVHFGLPNTHKMIAQTGFFESNVIQMPGEQAISHRQESENDFVMDCLFIEITLDELRNKPLKYAQKTYKLPIDIKQDYLNKGEIKFLCFYRTNSLIISSGKVDFVCSKCYLQSLMDTPIKILGFA